MADDHDRIIELEAAAKVSSDRIEALETAALDAEALGLVKDARIAELIAEVEGLHAAMEHRSVIEQAKGVLMSTMHGEEAAFAVLVAAAMCENVKLRDVAERIASAQHEQSRSSAGGS